MTGVSLRLVEMVLQGAAPTAALAILLDRLLEGVATTAPPGGFASLFGAAIRRTGKEA